MLIWVTGNFMIFSGPDRLRLRVETSSRLDGRMVPEDLPLLVARNHGGAHQPGMEHGYHLYPDGTRIPVPGCSDGLVQPVDAELVAVVDDGWRYLTIGRRWDLKSMNGSTLNRTIGICDWRMDRTDRQRSGPKLP